MRVSIVVARSANHVIGNQGNLPWHLPEDFEHFKSTTLGHPIIMGRATFESIGKPLPGRTSIVITRNMDFRHEGVTVVNSLVQALDHASQINDQVFIVGGGEIYRQSLELGLVDELIVSEIAGEYEGDVFFEVPESFVEVERTPRVGFDIVRYEQAA